MLLKHVALTLLSHTKLLTEYDRQPNLYIHQTVFTSHDTNCKKHIKYNESCYLDVKRTYQTFAVNKEKN